MMGRIEYVYCRGSYARLFAGKALESDAVWEVEAFFLPCSIATGACSQHIVKYLVETIPINEYNIHVRKYLEAIYGLFNY